MEDEISEELIKLWMKRRLSFFFMPSFKKYFAINRKFPVKFFIQILKIVIVTIQLILFGTILAQFISYAYNSRISFENLYLNKWSPSYETLPYPPSSGTYALYTEEDLLNGISYALDQFNKTDGSSVGGFNTRSMGKLVKICLTKLPKILNNLPIDDLIKTKCIEVDLQNHSSDEILPNNLVSFLDKREVDFTPNNFELLKLHFALDSPVVIHSFWVTYIGCYLFNVRISFDKSFTNCRVLPFIESDFFPTRCPSANGFELFQNNDNFRENLSITFDACNIILSVLSMTLCIRGLYRGIKLYYVTRIFFKKYLQENLVSSVVEFIPKWYLLIITGDFFIFIGSLIKLNIASEILNNFKICSYFIGLGAMLAWFSILKYVDYSHKNSILLKTLTRAIPSILRFMVCSIILFIAFALCGWLVLGPYNIKFSSFLSTLECLFSLVNGDDMFVTFSIIDNKSAYDIIIFSRVYLYTFIVLFIYIVLNLFMTIIFESYESVKEIGEEKFIYNQMIFNFLNETSDDYSRISFIKDESLIINTITGKDFSLMKYIPWLKRCNPCRKNDYSNEDVNETLIIDQ